jgi:hypothetical protein
MGTAQSFGWSSLNSNIHRDIISTQYAGGSNTIRLQLIYQVINEEGGEKIEIIGEHKGG